MSMTSLLSDHFLANIEVSLKKLHVSTKIVPYHKFKSIDKDVLLILRPLVLDPPEDLDQVVNLYSSTLMDLVEKYTPLRTKQMPQRALQVLSLCCTRGAKI